MFEPETEVVELQSRLGRVGSIQGWDPWKSRRSVEDAKWWVATVASLSYGNDSARNPEALFDRLVERGHFAVLEFVPYPDPDRARAHLPTASLRDAWSRLGEKSLRMMFRDTPGDREDLALDREDNPCHAFLVECPLYTRSQWMRHRSFAYLEMSRRYVPGKKVEWSYYGAGQPEHDGPDFEQWQFWQQCAAEYQRRLEAGWPNEIARGCMPVESLTKFWVAGFERDWEHFLELRDDAHAQPEIRVFATWIRNYITGRRK